MQGQRYPMHGYERWRCDGDLVCITSTLQHFQPSQLTNYSPKCKTTSYSKNVSVPMYFNSYEKSQPTLASQYDSIQKRFKAIKSKDRDDKAAGGPEETEIRFFKYIHVPDSPVWTKARIINNIPTQVLRAAAFLRAFESTGVLGENELCRKMLTEDLIRSGTVLNLQQIHVLRASDFVPGDVIAAWLSQRRLKPGLVTFLDPHQQVRLHKRSKSDRCTPMS